MNLLDITKIHPPTPWTDGDNIPWSDERFSKRMLAVHLSQNHNHASRQFQIIDQQIKWIHEEVLEGEPAHILDLTCGPGLYTSRLARLGHECVGIDYAPAAIEYAQDMANHERLACTYRLENVQESEYGHGYGLVMMLFGQFNVFRRESARLILRKAFSALIPGGRLLLEPEKSTSVEKNGRAGRSWYSCGEEGGLFRDGPHLCLSESFWNSEKQSSVKRFFVIDAQTNAVTVHTLTTKDYTDRQLGEVLAEAGFADVKIFSSLAGPELQDSEFIGVLAKKPNEPVIGI